MAHSAPTKFADEAFLDAAWESAQRSARAGAARPYGTGLVRSLRARLGIVRARGSAVVARLIAIVALAATVAAVVVGGIVLYAVIRFLAEVLGIAATNTLELAAAVVAVLVVLGLLTDWGRGLRQKA